MKPSKDETVVAHFGKLLGLEGPWQVHPAQLDLLRGRVELEVAWDEGAAVVCPECRKECGRHDHAPEREWRHLNVMQFLTVIKARVPRCRCPEHGVKTVRTPWAEPSSHFTLHFEAFAVQLIGACRSLTQVAELLELDWDGVQRLVRPSRKGHVLTPNRRRNPRGVCNSWPQGGVQPDAPDCAE